MSQDYSTCFFLKLCTHFFNAFGCQTIYKNQLVGSFYVLSDLEPLTHFNVSGSQFLSQG